MKSITGIITAAAVATLALDAGALGAQAGGAAMPAVSGGVTAPGWKGRIDAQQAARGRKLSEVSLRTMGSGIHATGGPAAIYWNPANTASGNYTVSATFTQMKKTANLEGYGLFVGGSNLDVANEAYGYFLVRQDGKFLINHRANDSTVHKMVPWTASSAIKPVDASGKATNALEVVVGSDSVSFRANGVQLHAVPRSQLDMGSPGSGTSGIAGIRVNHGLDVHVGDFAVKSGS